MSPVCSLAAFADRLRVLMTRGAVFSEQQFEAWALELHQFQVEHNAAYRTLVKARGGGLPVVTSWLDIPAVPTQAFKEFELTCLAPADRVTVFHSSGTTGQRPSRHFHGAASLALYETSLRCWFERQWSLLAGGHPACSANELEPRLLSLTPVAAQAPHSSLAHMFSTIARWWPNCSDLFAGFVEPDGAWALDIARCRAALASATAAQRPLLILGTAFNFVHLLDALDASGEDYRLPPGSWALETGGYKGRSRTLPKEELHGWISARLGLPRPRIVCEYGMSELSSQAYDTPALTPSASPIGPGLRRGKWERVADRPGEGAPSPIGWERVADRPGEGALVGRPMESSAGTPSGRSYHFPPWARARVISPETGREVADGETGRIRVWDLANVWSVLAVQTEDLAVRRGAGFEWIGRVSSAEPKGCSLMAT